MNLLRYRATRIVAGVLCLVVTAQIGMLLLYANSDLPSTPTPSNPTNVQARFRTTFNGWREAVERNKTGGSPDQHKSKTVLGGTESFQDYFESVDTVPHFYVLNFSMPEGRRPFAVDPEHLKFDMHPTIVGVSFFVWMDEFPASGEACLVSFGGWEHNLKVSVVPTRRLQFTVHLQNNEIIDVWGTTDLVLKKWNHIFCAYAPEGFVYIYVNREPDVFYKKPGAYRGLPNRKKIAVSVGSCYKDSPAHELVQGSVANPGIWYGRPITITEIHRLSLGYQLGPVSAPLFELGTTPCPTEKAAREHPSVPFVGKWAKPIEFHVPAFRSWDMFERPEITIVIPVEPHWVSYIPMTLFTLNKHARVAKVLLVELQCGTVNQEFLAPLLTQIFERAGAGGSRRSRAEEHDEIPRRRHLKIQVGLLKCFVGKPPEGRINWKVAEAINEAVKRIDTPWVQLLGGSVDILPGWLEHLWIAAQDNPQRSMYSSRLLYPSCNILSCGFKYHLTTVGTQNYALPFDSFRGYPAWYKPSQKNAVVDGVPLDSVLFKRELFMQVRGLDTTIGDPQLEAADFALKMRHVTGYSAMVVWQSVVIEKAFVFGEMEPRSYDVFPDAVTVFSERWNKLMKQQIESKYEMDTTVRWAAQCGGSMGFETSMFVQALEGRLPFRLQMRRFSVCEHTNTISFMPVAYRETIERTRLLSSETPEQEDDILIYHRDYREIGVWKGDQAKYTIGRYMFETDSIPKQWADSCNLLDEVWVPAGFFIDTFSKGGVQRDKIQVIPEAVDPYLFSPEDVLPYALPHRKKFVFLSVFKLEERKGWKGLIRAYVEEFDAFDDVSLYIRTYFYGSSTPYDKGKLVEYINRFLAESDLLKPNMPHWDVVIEHLSSQELMQLYRASDCFVLPTHGEGWGLPVVEAMAMGVPTIVTNWSGPTEFVTDQNGYPIKVKRLAPTISHDGWLDGFHWAEPDLDHFKHSMRWVINHPNEARKKGLRGRQDVITKFSPEVVGERIIERLKQIRSQTLAKGLAKPPPRDFTDLPISQDFHFCDYISTMYPLVDRKLPKALDLKSSSHKITAKLPRNECLPENMRVGVITTWKPKQCGIALFTEHLLGELEPLLPEATFELLVQTPMSIQPERYTDPQVVKVTRMPSIRDHFELARFINSRKYDALIVQHEFGLFGGDGGSYYTCVLAMIDVPRVITVLHTVLENMDDNMHANLRLIVERSNVVVVMSQMAVRYLEVYLNIQSPKLMVIPHGVPRVDLIPADLIKPELGLEGRRVISTFGLMHPLKGLEYLVNAMIVITKEHPDVLLLVAGRPHPSCGVHCREYMDWVRRTVHEQKLDNYVLFLQRFLSEQDYEQLLSASDIVTTPYAADTVSSSGQIARASAYGRVIVSTPFSHAKEMLSDQAGVLVPFKDSEALASAMVDLLSDPDRMREIGERAYMKASQMRWDIVAGRYLELLRPARACAARRVSDTYKRRNGETESSDPLSARENGSGLSVRGDQDGWTSQPERSQGSKRRIVPAAAGGATKPASDAARGSDLLEAIQRGGDQVEMEPGSGEVAARGGPPAGAGPGRDGVPGGEPQSVVGGAGTGDEFAQPAGDGQAGFKGPTHRGAHPPNPDFGAPGKGLRGGPGLNPGVAGGAGRPPVRGRQG